MTNQADDEFPQATKRKPLAERVAEHAAEEEIGGGERDRSSDLHPPEDAAKFEERMEGAGYPGDGTEPEVDAIAESLVTPQEAVNKQNTGKAQSIDIPPIEGVSEIHGLAETEAVTGFPYHIHAQVVQPGNCAGLSGMYRLPCRITAATYAEVRLMLANQHQVEVGSFMLISFQELSES